jgi:exopolyphosphatase/guanosine-5'-triphosphate,3'-diphosphate pyrophosphatase
MADNDVLVEGPRPIAMARPLRRDGIEDVSSLPAERREGRAYDSDHGAPRSAASWSRGGTRLGVLDIGSNSAQLQIVDLRHGGPPLPAYAVKEPTLLGEEITEDGAITPTGLDRVVDATCRAMAAALEHRVDQLYVFATAAIRDATNRDEVLDRVEADAGVRPQYLSGEDEARLTYHAAHRWYGWSANRILLLDIGGGTMEIALGRDAEPELALSIPLGARLLTRTFLPDDPPGTAELRALRGHIRSTVREVTDRVRWEGAPARAVATSKTFKQLARLTGSPPQRKGPFAARSVAAVDLGPWIRRMATLPAHKRAKLPGVSAARGRQILAGALVAKLTMDALDINVVDVCPWALREGIMLHYLQNTQGESWTMPLHHVCPGNGAFE